MKFEPTHKGKMKKQKEKDKVQKRKDITEKYRELIQDKYRKKSFAMAAFEAGFMIR